MEDNQENKSGYGKRPLWQWILLYAVIAIVVYGGYYLFVMSKNYHTGSGNGYNTNSQATQATPTNTQAQPAAGGATMAASMQQITVTGSEFAFTPSTITLKKGEQAEITFKNTGAYPHNLSITDLGVKTKTIRPGEQDTISFTPDKTGSFQFLCTVPGHADKGMKGMLVVQ